MHWTGLHGKVLAKALGKVLGASLPGTMAFVRCLTPGVVKALAADRSFAPSGWQVLMVADREDAGERTVTADRAVEIREAKGDAVLLLIDTAHAGAGMDSIYSAAREVGEVALFQEAGRLALRQITTSHSSEDRRYAEQAIKKARGRRGRYALSRWAEFDFLCQVAAGSKWPGSYLHLLGLWPIRHSKGSSFPDDLDTSRMLVDRLLGTAGASLAPATRIDAVRFDRSSETEINNLERFLHSVDTKPLRTALETLAEKETLWIGNLRTEPPAQSIQHIELTSWRNRNGTVARWSGLVEDGGADNPPELILRGDADKSGPSSILEIRWKIEPARLEKNAADYRVVVETDQGEEIASEQVPHSARKGGEKHRFTEDDFQILDENARLSAKVTVEVVDKAEFERQESEEFVIRFGDPPKQETGGVGTKVRTLSEGLAELESREAVSAIVSSPSSGVTTDSNKGIILLRTPVEQGRRKSFRVFRPSLIAEVESQWVKREGRIGRWIVTVRGSGERAGAPEFKPFPSDDGQAWESVAAASRKLAIRFAEIGGVGQIYDEMAGVFRIVHEYLRAWVALLQDGDPLLSLANTVEVQSLSERTIGLIVLPAHPLRVAWHAAYDNLVLHTAFAQGQAPKDIRAEFSSLNGAMFPTFLPNPNGGAFVFADMLGFHSVGMVPDTDKEPKAAVAILARALGAGEVADSIPAVGSQSAQVLADEVVKYLDCHDTSRLLHIHALRAGDGQTVARSLGTVQRRYRQDVDDADQDGGQEYTATAPIFSLDLYPTTEQRGVAGRFIAEAREKRRSGAGVLAEEDRWMLESLSLPGGVNMPRLRWARKEQPDPSTAAHLAIAFDTFESRVVVEKEDEASGPPHAFGLLSFYKRYYTSLPSPAWSSIPLKVSEGERHPSRRTHTEWLARLQHALQDGVARHIGANTGRLPVLRTEVPPEKGQSLKQLHQLCDWLITLDRNAGIEYFDSPQDNRAVYDAYVIDCVPEREDLGCLQLITSTANLEEVCSLLDGMLDQMGLSRGSGNAAFLLRHLKALSGRLAIRLTGHRRPTSELIALAMSHANCQALSGDDDCWGSLEDGVIIPVDDVRDLLPPLMGDKDKDGRATRPDLIYVTVEPRKGLCFQFIEVKFRRHLRTARSSDILKQIDKQTQTLREQWEGWYGGENVCSTFRAIRRAKLARVLRFYADKARRHCLPAQRHGELMDQIDRMIERGRDYTFASTTRSDRGWLFCPEYSGHQPLRISPDHYSTQIYLFGPGLLPDSNCDSGAVPSERASQREESMSTGSHAFPANEPAARQANDAGQASDALLSNKDGRVPDVHLGTDMLTNAGVDWRLGIDGNPHLLIAGLPGMGKTTCLVNLCKKMVAADVRPVVFSYHQDIDERLHESLGEVRFVDFDGLGFNPLQVIDRNGRMAHLDVAGAVRDIFTAIFPDLGDIQADRIRHAIKESFEEAGWIFGNESAPEPEFKRFVEILHADENPDRGLRTLLARLGELDDYGFFETGDGSRNSLWEDERPIIIRIHTTQNDNLQRAFAYLVFYGLYKDMFRRGIQKRITHALIFDEAHRAARLKLIPTMAKECRKYGISLVLASQEARDFDVSIFSAVANYLIFRSTDADAKFLVRNVSNSKQEKGLIDRIKQMDRFRALYFGESRHRPAHIVLSPP